MQEFPQSLPNLTSMSTNLFELMKGGNLVGYPDEDLRSAVERAVAIESSRGLKIAKEKASHRIDVLVALAIAALGAVERPTSSSTPPGLAKGMAAAAASLNGTAEPGAWQSTRSGREHSSWSSLDGPSGSGWPSA